MPFQDKADLLNVLANAQRLQMLTKISAGEISVGVLAREIGLSQSALSQHLAKLRAANLVQTRREAQNVFYFVSSDKVAAVLNLLDEMFDGKAERSRLVS